jgi:hypothetical protein
MARNNKYTTNLNLNIDNSTDSSHLATVTIGNGSDANAYMNIRYTTAASSTSTGALRVGGGAGIGGKLYTGNDIHSAGHLYLAADKDIFMNYSSTDYPILENFNNKNIVFNAASGGLYIGYKNTTSINMYYSTDASTRT